MDSKWGKMGHIFDPMSDKTKRFQVFMISQQLISVKFPI